MGRTTASSNQLSFTTTTSQTWSLCEEPEAKLSVETEPSSAHVDEYQGEIS